MLNVGRKLEAVRYSLFITELCNKRCNYCDIPDIRYPKDSITEFIETYLPMIDKHNFESYTLTGGEPAKSHNVDLVFDIITKPIKVNTNGLFIEKGYFDKYYDQIDELSIHPICEMKEVSEFAKTVCNDKKITLYVPFDNNNWQLIPQIVKENPDRRWNFIPHIFKRRVFDDGYDRVTLKSMKKLWSQICDFTNIQASSMALINKLTEETIPYYRLFCQNSNTRYLFDFCQRRIYRCAKSRVYNDCVYMVDDTIEKAGRMELFEPKEEFDISCKDCYYFAYFFPYALRNQIIKSKNERNSI